MSHPLDIKLLLHRMLCFQCPIHLIIHMLFTVPLSARHHTRVPLVVHLKLV